MVSFGVRRISMMREYMLGSILLVLLVAVIGVAVRGYMVHRRQVVARFDWALYMGRGDKLLPRAPYVCRILVFDKDVVVKGRLLHALTGTLRRYPRAGVTMLDRKHWRELASVRARYEAHFDKLPQVEGAMDETGVRNCVVICGVDGQGKKYRNEVLMFLGKCFVCGRQELHEAERMARRFCELVRNPGTQHVHRAPTAPASADDEKDRSEERDEDGPTA